MSTENTDPVDTNDVSALDAARDYFKADPAPENKKVEPAKDAPPPEKKGVDLSSIIKLPGDKAPPVEKKVEPVVPEAIDKDLAAPDEKSKSRAGWDELKKRGTTAIERARTLETELAQARAEVEAAKKGQTPPAADEATKARLAKLEEENKRYSDRIKVIDVKSHPEFQQKYIAPQKTATADMTNLLAQEEVKDVDLNALLSLKGKAFNQGVSEVLEQLTPYARVKFQKSLDVFVEAQIGGEQAVQAADEFLKTANTNVAGRSRQVFDQVSTGYKGMFIPAVIPADLPDESKAIMADYNAALDQVSKNAEKIAFGQMNENEVADAANKAALFDFVINKGLPRIAAVFNGQIEQLSTKNAELEAQIAAMTAAKPKVGGGAGGGSDPTPAAEKSNLEAARDYFPTR